jgi:hypothetical protein
MRRELLEGRPAWRTPGAPILALGKHLSTKCKHNISAASGYLQTRSQPHLAN